METATFHITTLNILFLTCYFILQRSVPLLYLCVIIVLMNKGILLW